MKPTVPALIMKAATALREYGPSAEVYVDTPDGECRYLRSAGAIISDWVIWYHDAEPTPEPVVPEPATDYPFTPGHCLTTFESDTGCSQRYMLHVAWSDGALVASDQAYPKIPTRRYTEKDIVTVGRTLYSVWKYAHGMDSAPDGSEECRIYRDAKILFVATSDTVWVIPNDDYGRVDRFMALTFRDSWLFEGGTLPSTVTSRPAAMAAFAFAGLV